MPIWDQGENGTPINDNNYFARYVYWTVSTYAGRVKFWEIINEPDYTPSGFGWRPAGMEGNWFDNPPNPCDLKNIKAPIYYYIRMMRIAYEVIKVVDPEAFVAIAPLGYPSFWMQYFGIPIIHKTESSQTNIPLQEALGSTRLVITPTLPMTAAWRITIFLLTNGSILVIPTQQWQESLG
ncbi:MAG: hypothetical protein R2795_03615 [Saprospiraceae bacterium]